MACLDTLSKRFALYIMSLDVSLFHVSEHIAHVLERHLCFSHLPLFRCGSAQCVLLSVRPHPNLTPSPSPPSLTPSLPLSLKLLCILPALKVESFSAHLDGPNRHDLSATFQL
jgi:hypothetical protein